MVETKNVVERLIKFLNSKNIPFARMERMAGFSNGYLRNNKGNMPGTRLAEVIECFPELNGDWLLTGRGDMLLPTEEELKQKEEEKRKLWESEYLTKLEASSSDCTHILQTGDHAISNKEQGSNSPGSRNAGRDYHEHKGLETDVEANGNGNTITVVVAIDGIATEVDIDQLKKEYERVNQQLAKSKAENQAAQIELLGIYRKQALEKGSASTERGSNSEDES